MFIAINMPIFNVFALRICLSDGWTTGSIGYFCNIKKNCECKNALASENHVELYFDFFARGNFHDSETRRTDTESI